MSSPLIDRLKEEFQYPELNAETLDSFLESHETVMLFLTENPLNFPETSDVAVILPELVTAFQGQFAPAIVHRDIERDMQRKFGFKSWPSLLFLRNGEYLGVISKVQNWSDYLIEIQSILASETSEPPQVKYHIDSRVNQQANV